MTQAARLESLERFRQGAVGFLLATDVAARGLDILGVQSVVNFDAPSTLASYLHRVGRTARAGKAGRAVTLAEDADRALLKEVRPAGGAASSGTAPVVFTRSARHAAGRWPLVHLCCGAWVYHALPRTCRRLQ